MKRGIMQNGRASKKKASGNAFPEAIPGDV